MDPTKAIRMAMMVAKGVSSVTDKPLFKKDGGEVDDDSLLPQGRAQQRMAANQSFGRQPTSIIKEKGGQWLEGSVGSGLQDLQPNTIETYRGRDTIPVAKEIAERGIANLHKHEGPEREARAQLMVDTLNRAKRYQAVNDWVGSTLKKYVMRDMATEHDPVRALAEKGILHVNLDQLPYGGGGTRSTKPFLQGQKLLGQSDLAHAWEKASDNAVNSFPAEKLSKEKDEVEKNPWLKTISPDTPIHFPDYNFARHLGFHHLVDELHNSVREDSDLPQKFRLRPESLQRMSMAQAVKHVHDVSQWRDENKAEANRKKAFNPAVHLHKDYPDSNLAWYEIKPSSEMDPGEKPQYADRWMVGGAFSKKGFESEEAAQNHIDEMNDFIKNTNSEALKNQLRDFPFFINKYNDTVSEGRPASDRHLKEALKYEADVMGHCVGTYTDAVLSGDTRIFSLRNKKTGEPHVTIESSSEPDFYDDMAGDYADEERMPSIEQIKGKGNRKPVSKYIPYVQDFVKSQNWGNVNELHHADMVDLNNHDYRNGVNKDAWKQISQNYINAKKIPPRFVTEEEHQNPSLLLQNVIQKARGGSIAQTPDEAFKNMRDPQKAIRRALMVARSAKSFGGANTDDEPHLSQIIKRGQPILPKTPDPTNEELAAARADTRVGSDIVNQRLNKIVPESSRVVGGQYTPGAPGGGRWSDLPREVLESRGTGFNVQDHELHALWQQAVNESSQAAKNAVAQHKIVPTFGASDWHKAMSLPIKDRLWYELSGEKMAENMPDLSAKEHMHFMDLVGATSAKAEPGENLERALGVLSQSLRGKPVDVDLTQPSAVRQALSRKGQDSSALPGNKTGHFSDTLALAGGVPTRFPISVNDVWVGRMFGVPDDVMSQNQSLHEPMALYFNKIRDLYNQRHGHEAPFVHQSWNFQAPAWVHLRDPNAEVSSGDAYHQVWGKIVKKLKDANISGIEGDKITRKALMHPGFADALRRTTPAFRNAPKATIEFGTKLTSKGERARQLYDLAVQNGDTVSQKDYLNTLVGTMYHSARGKLHPWDRLKKAITGNLSQGSDITRIMHPTKDDPLSVGGTFEGDVSPNIRVPLKDMSDDHIAMFNALAGGPLRQAAMATSKIHTAEAGSEPREGHIRGHSIFVPTLNQIHPDDIRSFAKSLTQAGHDMSYVRHPNGYQFDALPNFNGDVPTGISEDQLNNSYHQTLEAKHPNAEVIAHDFSSVYTPDSEYGKIRSKLIGGIKNDFIRQARLAGMEDREARGLLKQSVSSSDVPEASRRAWLAHRARIDHLTQAEKQLKAFAQQVEANHSAFIDRAEKRMRLAPKNPSGQPLSVSEPEKSTGGIVDHALRLVSHLSRR